MNKKEFWQAVYIAAVRAGEKYPGYAADDAVARLDSRIESGKLPPIDPPAGEAPNDEA